MKSLYAIVTCMILSSVTLVAQVKTIETTTTIDSTAAGQTTSKSTTTKIVEEVYPPLNNMITVNPLKFFLYYNLNYYHAVTDGVVIGGGLQMPTLKDIGGFGANLEARFHPSGKRMRGFYVAPNTSFNRMSTSYTRSDSSGTRREETVSTTAISIGALIGWQWFPGDEFAMGLGIGFDRYFLSSESDDDINSIFSAFSGGFTPALRFDIGYAW